MGTPIESSSLVFTTREFYLSGSTDSAKGSTLTFEELDNTLIFLSQSISEGGSGTYESVFPDGTTVPYAVGGIAATTNVATLNGKTFSEMFDELLFPTINPTSNPGSFSSTTSRDYEEIGNTINVTVTSTFTKGTWAVVGQSNRDYYGAATEYFYSSPTTPIFSNNLNTNYTFPNYVVTSGANNFPTAVSHSVGEQPVDSKGNDYLSPIPAGKLTDPDVSFTGIYPWFYGSSSADTLSVADVVTAIESLYGMAPSTSTKKLVTLSTGTIIGNFPQSNAMWCWFATPSTSTTKQSMYQNAFNSNAIGPAGTFNSPTTATITAAGYWNNISYKIYITNARTVFDSPPNEYTVELRN